MNPFSHRAVRRNLINRFESLHHEHPSYRWWVLANVMLGTFMAVLDATIVNVALPKLMGSFGVSVDKIEWVVTAYLLVFAVTAEGPGGVFAPALFIGATLGGAFGLVTAALFPGLGLSPAAFALVGMAAILAGAVHAPLTAVLLLFEMTNDYHIILTLMFAVAVSLVVSRRIEKDSVYAMGLARHGIRLDRGRDVEVMGAISVGDAMNAVGETLPETMSLGEAAETMARARHHGLPVVNAEGWLTGILTVQDIERAAVETVGEACTREVEVAFPDESLNMALRRMSHRDVGRLPVVARENPRHLLGLLRRADVIRAYDIALTRRVAQRHQEQAARLDALTSERVDILDVAMEIGAPAVDLAVKDIPFPRGCVIASVRRGRQVFIPRGETVLHAGDMLVVVAEGAARDEMARLCHRPDDELT